MSYIVRFIDYDGTILQETTVTGGSVTPPSIPSHDYLIFNSWNNTEYLNIIKDIDIGSIYDTVDDITYAWISLVSGVTSLSQSIFLEKTDAGEMSIDYGDGITGSTTATGIIDFTHIYSDTGDYLIKITFNGRYNIPNNFLQNVSNQNNTLKKIYLCKYVYNINISAFDSCYSLSSITIPSGVTSIGNSAFSNCYSLSSITIPNGVTSIGNYAFSNCYSLQSITIPNSVTSIGNSAFSNCYSLQNINIPSGVTSIGNSVFSYCSSLSSITIPSGVNSIGSSVFYYCYSLSSITIPSGVTIIGNDAFSYCYSLSSVTIPSGVTSIGNSAFYNCYSLSSVTIPSGVTSIGNYAFRNGYSLSYIKIYSTTPPAIQSDTFIGTNCPIYIPTGTLAVYSAATNWSAHISRFIEY